MATGDFRSARHRMSLSFSWQILKDLHHLMKIFHILVDLCQKQAKYIEAFVQVLQNCIKPFPPWQVHRCRDLFLHTRVLRVLMPLLRLPSSCADQTHSTMSTANTRWVDSTFEQITDLCDGLRWTETSPVRLSPSNSMHQWSLWNLGEGEWRRSPLLFSRNEGEGVSVISVLPCRQWRVLFD